MNSFAIAYAFLVEIILRPSHHIETVHADTLIINKDGSFKYAEGLFLKDLVDFDDIYNDEYEFVNSEESSTISSESEGKTENSYIAECFT